ncbi:MAG: family acetyltransferase, partial [Sphingomonas bacterium]|nr:family acetyltransferase [Sphingomonas bacterium]
MVNYRDATGADLPAIIALLAEDQIGGRKDDPGEPLDPVYAAAFAAIDSDPNQRLIVAEEDRAVIGTMQLSFLPGLLNRGAWRGQIEAVR